MSPGAGGGSRTKAGAWVISFSLRPIRGIDGAIDDGGMILWRPCADDAAVASARRELPVEGELVEVEVDLPERIPGLEFRLRGAREAAFITWSPAEDAELRARADALEPPHEFVDAELGALVFDRRLRWYEGTHATADGRSYRIAISPKAELDPAPSVERARAFVRWVDGQLEALISAAVGALYPTWDDAWRQPEEDAIDRDAFARRLTVRSVQWDAAPGEERATVWIDDDGLFGGHTIEVTIVDRVVERIDV